LSRAESFSSFDIRPSFEYRHGVSDITRILDRAHQGDPKAAAELLPLVYEELRKIAAHKMAEEGAGHTLQPTALVHEAWLRLAGDANPQFEGRAHFFAAAAEAMRRILIESARRKARLKRGGHWERVNLEDIQLATESDPATLLTIDQALEKLAREHPEKAELVKLRFFVGLSLPEAARALNLSETTAKRHWAFARAWLYGELAGDD
jgi:RNA polymerase sigma factor (TIGR02999 family)